MFNFSTQELIAVLFAIPCVLLSLSFHEFAHAWVAYKLGDPTARNLGRLTLNPLKHIDPIGALCMLFFRFGWAKPVPINMRRFKNPRVGMAISAAAGPISNLILALVSAVVYVPLHIHIVGRTTNTVYLYGMIQGAPTSINLQLALLTMVGTLHILNVSLALFNLIPINPLDGSRIVHLFLPPKVYFWLMNNEKYIYIALLALLWTGILSTPLSIAANFISGGMLKLINLIPFLG